MKKLIKMLPMLAMATVLVSCNDRYQEGFDSGYNSTYSTAHQQGYDEGYEDGDAAGFERGEIFYSTHTTYQQGFDIGRANGIAAGNTNGYNAGVADGRPIGFAQAVADGTYATWRARGYNDGYDDGFDDGYEDGLDDGYDDGYDDGDWSIRTQLTNAYNNGYDDGYDDGFSDGDWDGYNDGWDDGYDDGYDIGWDDGYDVGYDDGWYDGGGLSVGALVTNNLVGRTGLLSKIHNDLVNYSKIAGPKKTARGLEVNGKLIFEETSMTSKDLEKRAAAMEKYLVVSMGKQIAQRFALSQERSLQIAKVSNLWRKYATSRGVSEADADAYTKALIGVNLKAVEQAYKDSLKGDVAPLNKLIKEAAVVNGTTPENVTRIMNQVFFK